MVVQCTPALFSSLVITIWGDPHKSRLNSSTVFYGCYYSVGGRDPSALSQKHLDTLKDEPEILLFSHLSFKFNITHVTYDSLKTLLIVIEQFIASFYSSPQQ